MEPSPAAADRQMRIHPDGTVGSAQAILQRLISFPTVSSSSNTEISDWCSDVLRALGFTVHRTQYADARGVQKANLVAVRHPHAHETLNPNERGLAYFCHTDVVPAEQWNGPKNTTGQPANPFSAVTVDDRIYGRGACDMKGSLAAMLSAVARLPHDQQRASIWIVCTADEEVGFGGAKHLVEHCHGYRELAKANPVTIIGEPTELKVVYAHKGISGFTLRSQGRAGHSATDYGINANEAMVPMLQKLLEICDRTRRERRLQDPRFSPPVLSWNFGVSDHSNVINITPERSDAWVSFRSMPEIDGQELVNEIQNVAQENGLSFRVIPGCAPLWNDPTSEIVKAFEELSGSNAETVSYATDGGVLEELSHRIVIGPGSINQAHTVDEWISIDQLSRGIDLYERAIQKWCMESTCRKPVGDRF